MKSKQLFDTLLIQIKSTDQSEAAAILIHFFEATFSLNRTQIMLDTDVDVRDFDFTTIIQRINDHEPIQYVTQTAWFAGHRFFVNPSVLIPRPETEMIVQYVTQSKNSPSRILDVGTGSGCIAISIKLGRKDFEVVGVDVSDLALEVARRNASSLHANVKFEKNDFLLDDVATDLKFDFLVSNPPYVLENEKPSIEKNVFDYEPHLALFVPDSDPLLFYRALAAKGKMLLRPHGEVIAEINPRHSSATLQLFSMHGFSAEVFRDLDGKERMIVARLT